MKAIYLFCIALFLLTTFPIFSQKSLGIFTQSADIGPVLHKRKTEYDAKTGEYRLSGSGANIWFKKDEFHYTYKKLSGNFILQTRGKLIGTGVDAHRKFGWMARTGLDTSDAMICATVHGDGLTAIQYRIRAGTNIEEVKSPVKMPDVKADDHPFYKHVYLRLMHAGGGRLHTFTAVRAASTCRRGRLIARGWRL